MNLLTTKLLVALLFGLLRFFFGILPVKLYRCLVRWEGEELDDGDTNHFINKKRHQQVTCALALCQSFGGGVLLATCFLHMMPEVYLSMEQLKQYGNLSTEYPLSQLIICFGFFLVYFLEEFSHWFVTKVPETDHCYEKSSKSFTSSAQRSASVAGNRVTPIIDEKPPKSAFLIANPADFYSERLEALSDCGSLSSTVLKENEKNANNNTIAEKVLEIDEDELQKVDQVVEKQAKTKQQCVRYVLVVVALSLHAIFEGLAIGLQQSTANIWYLFIAVSIHSATILFYISMELLLAKTKIQRIVINVSVLSVTSPFGVIVGLLITQNANMNTRAKSTAVVLLEGISAGTILYITFFEVLNREKERRAYTFLRAMFILSGFLLMAVLQCAEMYVA